MASGQAGCLEFGACSEPEYLGSGLGAWNLIFIIWDLEFQPFDFAQDKI
jgi:hypothetical protein